MKIKLPKTLAEPLTIPWKNINNGVDREIEKLLSALLDEAIHGDMEMDEIMAKLSDRLDANLKRIEKNLLLQDILRSNK